MRSKDFYITVIQVPKGYMTAIMESSNYEEDVYQVSNLRKPKVFPTREEAETVGRTWSAETHKEMR